MLVLGQLAVWVGAVGTTRYVDDNTCPATGSGTLADPYCKIQNGICYAVSGDTVSVAPGTYLESLRMKPGVSLVSQGGASVTTINGAGLPCMLSGNYCTRGTSPLQCSVVIFPAGHTPSTTLDGFTITGGGGALQTPAPPAPPQVAGGGIFVFSSPTISNNIITNNVLAGSSTYRKFLGGGIFVAVGAPVITGNTISGNRAIPGAGTSGATTFGEGGAVYVGWNTSPTITNNIISNNRAGDPNLAFSTGTGGGIAVYPGDANHPGTIIIDRNTITDNEAGRLGGGVDLNSFPGASAQQAILSNNVIVGNKAFNGGGVYVYFNKAKVVNNTIVDNEGKYGGGIYSGTGDPNLPTIISNNVIVGNRLRFNGNGGGLYTLNYTVGFDPNIEANDFYNNATNNVAGDFTDAQIIGSYGNFLADPNFVNQAGRDLHLNANSPAIDRAYASRAPAVDRDNKPRGYDGNGTPNSPQAGDNDVGAYEWYPPCTPTTEVCDGADNDCDTLIDEGNPGGGLTCTTGLPGVCSAGTTNCVGGTIVCTQNVQSSSEICDNLDNDCDGSTDEGNPGGGVSCNTGLLGVCAAGTTACQSGSLICNQNVQSSPEACDNLDNDCDGSVDEGNPGGGGACSTGQYGVCGPGTLTCQSGSLGCVRNVGPSAEVCDGLDNNCDGFVDEGFLDTDLDGLANCIDPDDDNDGALDALDCAPLDVTAFGVPVEVANVSLAQNGATTVSYDIQSIGSGTRYQIVSGLLSRIIITQSFNEDFCVAPSASGGSWQDTRPNPPRDDAWFYMIRSTNSCGAGTYGGPLIDQPRPSNVCQNGIVDADFDGSPSDLDCNDADPNVAPLRPEICDGVDNNCAGGIDEGNPGGGASCGTGQLGVCGPGTVTCQSGSLGCVRNVEPSTEVCDNLDNDCDGSADEGNPGGGVLCNTGQLGVCAAGTTACQNGFVICNRNTAPSTDLCDGLDNDCDGQSDEGFLNTDGDSMADCVDPDDDNDGALDGFDCAPLNLGAWGVPTEVENLDVLDSVPTQLTWTIQTIGPATQYEAGSGAITIIGSIPFPAGSCLPTVSGPPATDSRPAPPPGEAFYYLVKSRNVCGSGTYGTPDRDTHPSCP